MLPVLPALGGLARGAVSGGANIIRGGAKGVSNIVRSTARTARTATRNATRNANNNAMSIGASGGNIGSGGNNIRAISGDLNNVTQSLQEQANALQEINNRLQQTQIQSSKLSKIWHGMGGVLNKVLVTPLKKAFGFLGGMLRTARNLVMALGAIALGTFFSNAKGQIEKHRKAGQSGVDARQLKAYNRAKAMHGLGEDEFNLANLQTLLGSQDSYAVLGQLGLRRDEVVGKNGIEAMEMVQDAIYKKLQTIPKHGVVWDDFVKAVMESTGIDIRNEHNRKLFDPKNRQSFNKEYEYFYKTLKDTKTLVEAQKAIARVQYKIKDLGESLSVWLAPYITRIADAVSSFLNDPESVKGFGNIIEKIFTALKNGATAIKDIFTEDVMTKALSVIGDVGSAIAKLAKETLPFFLEGLGVLAKIINELAEFIADPKAWFEKAKTSTSEYVKDMARGSISQLQGYGTKTQQLNSMMWGVGSLANWVSNGALDSYQNEAIEKDFQNFYNKQVQMRAQKQEIIQRKEVTIKLDTGAGEKVIYDTASIIGGGQ